MNQFMRDDVDTDGTADTLILSSVHDYDDSAYGNLITDYGNMGNLYTNNVLSMSFMFEMCEKLPHIDVSNFVTSNVIKMEWMFDSCNNVTELDISNFDTCNANNMQCMFADCTNLNNIKVGSNWSTTLAENTNFNKSWYNHSGYGTQNGVWYMFYNCGTDNVTEQNKKTLTTKYKNNKINT